MQRREGEGGGGEVEDMNLEEGSYGVRVCVRRGKEEGNGGEGWGEGGEGGHERGEGAGRGRGGKDRGNE